jgi:ribosome-binding factor A
MANRRLLRVADLLREELSDIIRRSVHDPRVNERDFTVTRVEVSADLSRASVHVSTLATDAERDALIDGLRHAAGFIHRELLQRIRLKTVPALEFEYDPGLAKAQRIADILHELNRGKT